MRRDRALNILFVEHAFEVVQGFFVGITSFEVNEKNFIFVFEGKSAINVILIRFYGRTECVDGDFLKVPNLLTVFLDFLECLLFGFFVDLTIRFFSDFRNASRVTEFG